MIRNTLAVVIALGGLVAAVGCGGQSISIGGDTSGNGGELVSGGPATGGAVTGGATTGGAFPTGGLGGTGFGAIGGVTASGGSLISTGGTATGVASGGTTGVNGGSSTIPGQGGSSGAGSAGGGVIDPYPRVYWEGDLTHRACPNWGVVWGATCWYTSYGGASYGWCIGEGAAGPCNTCSCEVPCETSDDCPAALTGQRAVCLTNSANVPSCFVLCEVRTHCPTGMECLYHPETGDRVCAWYTDRVQ